MQVPRRERIQGDPTSVFCEPLAALPLWALCSSEDTAEGLAGQGNRLQIDFLASIAPWHGKVWLHSLFQLKMDTEMKKRKPTTPNNELIIAAN